MAASDNAQGERVFGEFESISAVELLTMAGYAFFFGWMFVSFYGLFCEFPPAIAVAQRDVCQLLVFIGIALGYGGLSIAGRKPSFNIFRGGIMAAFSLAILMLPLVALMMYQGIWMPVEVIYLLNFLAGVGAAGTNILWLDVCSRIKTSSYTRLIGCSLALGGALFALAFLTPDAMQPPFSLAFGIASISLLAFAATHTDQNDEAAPLRSVEEAWQFRSEIEPSFFVFSVVFALTFVFLFNSGRDAVFPCILAVIPGALIIAVLASAHKKLSITTIQRVLLVVTVTSCVAMPFVSFEWQLICSSFVVGAWAAFKAANFSFIVKKSTSTRDCPLFRQAPLRLIITAAGFALGWAIATLITAIYGTHSDAFTTVRLVMAVVLVIVLMRFLPVDRHHPVDGLTVPGDRKKTSVMAVSLSSDELLERRCQAVARLYQLSPREADILRYLAKGRNASWIQEELTISPHTVKSHIYNIYRKTDIHSHQKLMDFVESFPLEKEDIEQI